MEVRAEHLVLATGRFMGKGLGVRDEQIKEMLFDLPVTQPETRSGWLRLDFFDPAGHPVNRAGIETDDCFRPLDATGSVSTPGCTPPAASWPTRTGNGKNPGLALLLHRHARQCPILSKIPLP